MNLVMHQMKPCPREVGDRTINQLALTFGTLLSSQSTDAHPWKSLDRLRGNLIYVTGWARQLQIVSALPFRTPAADARVAASAHADEFVRVVPLGRPTVSNLPVRPLCGSPRGRHEVTWSLRLTSNSQVSAGFGDQQPESVQVGRVSRRRSGPTGAVLPR